MTIKPYDLLIFDWDGTLMDSTVRIVSCLREGMRQAGLPLRDDGQLRHIIGLGLEEAVDFLYPDVVDPGLKRKMMEVYRHQFLYADTTPAALFEGVTAMLDTLENEGYLLAVATGKTRSGLNSVWRELGMERRFHTSRCADETTSKPDPHMLREILSDLDVSPQRALMIGDTQFDIEMAHNAGVAAVAVAQGAHSPDQLLQKAPLVILERVTYLLSWLRLQTRQAMPL
ncbi:MAG TPA: HAD-IIIA family hydrolase [Gammaproteobacteria bacterium]|nr:HAD-IIIA family hydrolase [Gammaproteobacteria bacterium]